VGGIVLTAFASLHLIAAYFHLQDDSSRLKDATHLTTRDGFAIHWMKKVAPGTGRLQLVFIHGSPGGAGAWREQFLKPFPGADLIAFDRPGFGKSKRLDGTPHLQDQVNALISLLAQTGNRRVLLIGHSYGSPIALLAAIEHPEKIAGVLLIGGDVDPMQEKPFLVQYLFRWPLTSWLLPSGISQSNREMLTARSDLTELQKLLPNLAVPVVMLHGTHDPVVPVENVGWLERQLAGLGKSALFAKIMIPNANHFIPWEHPREVEQAIQLLDQMVSARERASQKSP